MNYTIVFSNRAKHEINKFSKDLYLRISTTIDALALNPRPVGCKKLTDFEDYRIRVGDYRIIYSIDDVIRIVSIERIAHRKDVYR